MKNALLYLLLVAGFIAKGQTYNNEWIDYTKTYYKFKVGRTGLHRISGSVLSNAGLASVQAQHLQLWRNGKQVPLYTSSSGTLSTADYIEFWGEMNDGKPDKELYRNTDFQLNDKWSLQTDTAIYFLTVNTSGANAQLLAAANNIAGNTLPAEPYFMHTVGRYFRDRINPGYAVNVGEYLYSSAYDKGEGWSSSDINGAATNSFSFENLFVQNSGPQPSLKIAISGNAIQPRSYLVKINNDSVFGKEVDYYNYRKDSFSFPLSLITSNTATVHVTNRSHDPYDRMVVHRYELTYPRQFNFGGASNFEFVLPASSTGNYLEISGFSYGTATPVLYDLTNGKRYVSDISNPSLVKVVLQPSATPRNLVLVSEDPGNITPVASLQQRTFLDLFNTNNQADFLIISNNLLFNGANGSNPVEEYRAYRSSVAGGGYNTKVYEIEELTDQFAFGIKKHPMAIRNFLRFARGRFGSAPKFAFLIGKAVHYWSNRGAENNPDINRLNLVPTFGWPASDVLLSADPGDAIPKTPIGRLSVINAQEVATYLKKVKEYEAAQKNVSPMISDRAWMKNVVHLVGAGDPTLQNALDGYMNTYKKMIQDTLFGANVTTFTKTSSNSVQQISSSVLEQLFTEGISMITYFGHSSSSTLEFNLNTPEQYNNQGKYPIFFALGCNAGNFFDFNTLRFTSKETLSEKYVLAQDKGTIGFIASSHFGIVHYLDIYFNKAYRSLGVEDYGKSIGENLISTIVKTFAFTSQEDFYARSQSEETILHGDPAIRPNTHAKPDYVIEEPMVKLSPSFISIADASFKLETKFLNIGKAVNQNIVVEISRTYPNQTKEVIFRDTIPGIRFKDSLSIKIPVDPMRDKGTNKLTVTIDAGNEVDELFETNNSITKEFVVYEDEARPVYPYNYSIVNRQNIKLVASTANAFSTTRTYRMELDTTELFNSSLKVSGSVTSKGGVLEFNPGTSFRDSTVYYWRVAMEPSTGPLKWNNASFIYMNGFNHGFNQSHLYQHIQSSTQFITLDSTDKLWKFNQKTNNLFIRNAVWGTATVLEADLVVNVNSDSYIRNTCNYGIIFNVFDKNTFLPWQNMVVGGKGLYESLPPQCGNSRIYNFEFNNNADGRHKAAEFLKQIPDGNFIVVRNQPYSNVSQNEYVQDWIGDASIYGAENTLYNEFKRNGFNTIDSFNRPRVFIAVYRKNRPGFETKNVFSEGVFDRISLSVDCFTSMSSGSITSPLFGPAKEWKEVFWKGRSIESQSTDNATIAVIGMKTNGGVDTLSKTPAVNQQNLSISSVDAKVYPYLQLQMYHSDTINYDPYQLDYWRLTYSPAPEGGLAPNLYLSMKDSLFTGEPLDFKVAFKNISDTPFDSLKVKMVITDRNNVQHILPVQKHRPLHANDTLHIRHNIDSRQFSGVNSLYVEVNPDNDQPEQHHFNNFAYRNFYVEADFKNPLMDVTFDNVHILNYDIVSARPEIIIQLKDEDKWRLLDDTSLVNVQVKYPNGTVRTFAYNNDTLQFKPAQPTANENAATVHFKPHFAEDGMYELIVSGKDKSGNAAGSMDYKVAFEVISKAMISNMLNYPNPFTTSTAFVFTITGAQVPQNLKIQILTVTGKIVREITKEELGPLHIGRNITEFKWNGTDQYGQRLGNGVYLYRVIAETDGKSLEKYRNKNEDTDKYFNKGYGKMYLMR